MKNLKKIINLKEKINNQNIEKIVNIVFTYKEKAFLILYDDYDLKYTLYQVHNTGYVEFVGIYSVWALKELREDIEGLSDENIH